MNQRRIGIDIDGVLANFYDAYERLAIEVDNGIDRFPQRGGVGHPSIYPPVWNWPEYYGYSSEVVAEVWRRIKADQGFWLNLDPLERIDLSKLATGHELYFITDRPGVRAKQQTEVWLRAFCNVPFPTVIISRKGKGIVCEALDLELYIDDKGENIVDVEARSPQTRAYLLNRPYNEHVAVQSRSNLLRDVLAAEDLIGGEEVATGVHEHDDVQGEAKGE